MAEIFKVVKECPNYEVSNTGRVIRRSWLVRASKQGGIRIVPRKEVVYRKMREGYISICMWYKGSPYRRSVHRLVAIAFIPNPENKPQVHHLDGNKQNNNCDNLSWATAKENNNYAIDVGLRSKEVHKVVMLDKNGQYLATFVNTCVAAELTGVTRSSIQGCCKPFRTGQISAGGYYWKYEADFIKSL